MNLDISALHNLIIDTHSYIVCGNTGKGNLMLSEVYECLLSLSETLPIDKVKMLSQLLAVMHDAHQRNDMIYLADILRFEVLKLILETSS